MTYRISQTVDDRIRRDLVAFADSRTQIVRDGDAYKWTWKRKAQVLEVIAVAEDEVLDRVVFNGQEFSYTEFFASEGMGALLWLAQEIERSLAAIQSINHIQTIPARVRIDEESNAITFDLALKRIAAESSDRTSLVFLQGRAGDGKSTSLVDLAQKQAAAFAAGRSSFLYLYIDAQGRSLSRLDEAIALILDDLNSNFGYQSLSVLTRLGLIVPVVDGFDELLGSGGYAEAFASLESFLFRLEGQGSVITSARSTFYQQSALSRAASRLSAASSATNITIHNIHLLPWDREATQQLLLQLGVGEFLQDENGRENTSDLYAAAARNIGIGADEILSSPLLTSAYASLLREGGHARPDGSIVEAAIRALVQREINEKILSARGDQILNEQQFEQLFSAVAEEMWWQETRTIDEETLVLVADLTLDQLGIEKSKIGALLGKLSSNAVIDLGEGTRKLSFRHEIYFSFFLGNYFKHTMLMGAPKDLAQLLGRSILPATLARQSAWLLQSDDELAAYMVNLSEPMSRSAVSDLINTNRGSLIVAALKHSRHQMPQLKIANATFSGADFSNIKLGQFCFHNCTFDEVDMTGIDAPQVTFSGSHFRLPLVDHATRINFRGLYLGKDIVGLRIRRDGIENVVYRFSQESNFLETLGLQGTAAHQARTLSEREKRILESIERILRFASRSVYFSETDFENRGFPKDLLPIGAKHNIWTASDRQKRGLRSLYRLDRAPEAIVVGAVGESTDVEVLAFWDEVFRAT